MIPIILATHGDFARGIKDGAEMLVGKSEKVEYVSLQPGDDFGVFQKKVSDRARELDEVDGVLVLADLLGGSPYNAVALTMARDDVHIECLTGLNMSMLLTALDQREYCNLLQLVEESKIAGVSNIVSVREKLMEQDEDDTE